MSETFPSQTPIRIILADDHSLVRDGIKSLLEEESDIEVIAEAADGREALEKVSTFRPDILIVDIRMPVMNGIQTVASLSSKQEETRSLVLSMHDSEEYVLQSVEAGAHGYLLKDTSKEEFIKAIHTIFNGGKYFSGDISPILVKGYLEKVSLPPQPELLKPSDLPSEVHLTKRQKEILELVIQGMSNQEIADHLGKSRRTVEAHRFSLMKKMGVKNLMELSNKAKELGLA